MGEPRMPILCSTRAVVKPAVPCSTMKQVRWRCWRTDVRLGIGDREDRHQACHVALADEALRAVDPPVVAVASRGRAGGSGVGAGLRLGQREGGQRPPRGQVGEPARLLLGRARQQERQRAERLDGDDQPARGAGAADLLDGQADGEEVDAEAAMLDRVRQGEHVVLGEQLDHVPGELGAGVDGRGPGCDAFVGQDADGVAEVALLVAQAEGHRAAPRITPPS